MMNFQQLALAFNRAFSLTLSSKKCFSVFCILALSGLLVVFFRSLAFNSGDWVRLSLIFLPIFLLGGILLSTGIFLIRIYHDEIKTGQADYRNIMVKSWEIIVGASYLAIPLILSYLVLWMILGAFISLQSIPHVGEFFSAILSFAPFLLNLAILLLCLATLLMLFFVAPLIALKGTTQRTVVQLSLNRLISDPFSNFILMIMALLPFLFTLFLLTLAAFLTGSLCLHCSTQLETVLEWFVIMVPFTACLTPTIIFFFNFAAEAHVLMQKQTRDAL